MGDKDLPPVQKVYEERFWQVFFDSYCTTLLTSFKTCFACNETCFACNKCTHVCTNTRSTRTLAI